MAFSCAGIVFVWGNLGNEYKETATFFLKKPYALDPVRLGKKTYVVPTRIELVSKV